MSLVNSITYKCWYNKLRNLLWQNCRARGGKIAIHNAAMMLSSFDVVGSLSKQQKRRFEKIKKLRNSFTFENGCHYGWMGQ
jgi:hypothetical protein